MEISELFEPESWSPWFWRTMFMNGNKSSPDALLSMELYETIDRARKHATLWVDAQWLLL